MSTAALDAHRISVDEMADAVRAVADWLDQLKRDRGRCPFCEYVLCLHTAHCPAWGRACLLSDVPVP